MLTRRDFLLLAAATPVAVAECARAQGQDSARSGVLRTRWSPSSGTASPGLRPLGLATGRDGLRYVPKGYDPARPTPLVVLLHGAGQEAAEWVADPILALADARRVLLLIPDSRGPTWDVVRGGFGPDVAFLDAALQVAFRDCNVDPRRIALGGFSDGGSCALSLGVGNGDLFAAVLAFSPGFMAPRVRRGKPRIFIAHGTRDRILPIDQTSRRLVPQLEADGYRVRFEEFDGGHGIRAASVDDALAWFLT